MARLIEGGEQPGPLSQSLQAGEGLSLQDAMAALPGAQRESLQRQLSPQALEELLDIAQEPDRVTLYKSLLDFGMRQERSERSDWAARSYSLVAEVSDLKDLQRRAQGRLQAVMDQGPVGPRMEIFLRRLVRTVSDPSSFLAMSAAGALFKVTRLAVLSRLATTPTANFLTCGFGARAAASLLAFAVEAPAFTITGQLANRALGNAPAGGLRGLGGDFVSSYFVLGGMKFTGWAMGAFFNRLHGINPLTGQVQRLAGWTGLTKHLSSNLGMFGGLTLGHRAAAAAGLSKHHDLVTTMFDSFAMFLQQHVASGLTPTIFGERFQALERDIEHRTELLARENIRTRDGPGMLDSLGLHLQGPLLASAGEIPSAGRPKESEPVRARDHIQLSVNRGDRFSGHDDAIEMRAQEDKELWELIQEASSLLRGDVTREKIIQNLASESSSMTNRLLSFMVKGRPLTEQAVLDEIMAYRELSRFSNFHEILEHQVLNHPLKESWQPLTELWFSGVRFSQSNGGEEPISSIQVRSYTNRFSDTDLTRTLREAATQLKRLQGRYPESRHNVIHVILRPEFVFRSSSEDLLKNFFQRSLSDTARSGVYKGLNLSRVSFLVDAQIRQLLHYFNFLVEGDAEARNTNLFREAPPSPDTHPL